jgi:signal transduction histidine kinase
MAERDVGFAAWPVTGAEQAWVLTAVVRHSPDFVAWHGLHQEAWVNPAAAAMAGGIDPTVPLPGRVRDLFEPESQDLIEHVGVPTMNETGAWHAALTIRNRETGEVRDIDWSMFLVRDGDGEVLGSAGVGRDVTERNRVLAELTAARADAEAANLIVAQEEERRRIAGDIHDDSVQALAAVAWRLDLIRPRLPAAEAALIDEVAAATVDATGRLRRLLFDLYPPNLDREGLVAAVRLYLAETFGPTGTTWSISGESDPEPTRATSMLAYRLTREALANVARHAGAATVAVTVTRRDGGVAVTVTDDGCGFDPDRATVAVPGHLGLRSLHTMAQAAGGSFRVTSQPGAGTTVELWLPGRPRSGPGH